MIQQSEPHRIPRYESSPRSVLLSQPIPFVSKSQPTPNLPLVQPNPTLQIVQPTPSLPLAQPNPTILVSRPIPIAQPTLTTLIKHKEELDRANPNLEPTQIKSLKDDNLELTEEGYEVDLTLVEQYDGEEELIEDLEDEATEYKEDKVQEQNPIEQSLEVVEFIKEFEQDINLIIAKGLERDIVEGSPIWTDIFHDPYPFRDSQSTMDLVPIDPPSTCTMVRTCLPFISLKHRSLMNHV